MPDWTIHADAGPIGPGEEGGMKDEWRRYAIQAIDDAVTVLRFGAGDERERVEGCRKILASAHFTLENFSTPPRFEDGSRQYPERFFVVREEDDA